MKYVILKMLAHNICDRAVYTEAVHVFAIFSSLPGYRKIGVTDGEKDVMLLSADKDEIELDEIETDDEKQKSKLLEIRENWLYQWTLYYKKKCEKEVKSVLDSASLTSRRQRKVDFKKEILKKADKCGRLFFNCRFEGYDFREINLNKAVFVSCDLSGCNFSGVNMTDSVFVNCVMKDILLYNAVMNNSFVYSGCEVKELKNL